MSSYLTLAVFVLFFASFTHGIESLQTDLGLQLENVPVLSIALSPNGLDVSPGVILELDDAQGPGNPTVDYHSFAAEDVYTLIMVDPDAPSRDRAPELRSWLHWLVTDIHISSRTNNTVVKYNPPSPPHGSGQHRYVFLLFKQPTNQIQAEKPVSRGNFHVANFVVQNRLKLQAYNYFVTENK